MMRTLVITLSLPVLLCLACAGDEPVSDDVSKGWRATQLVTADEETKWQGSADVDGSLDVRFDCPEGGSYHAVGTYDDGMQYDLTVDFDQCGADDVVIDGSLALHAEVAVDEHSTRTSLTYEGDLTWSGGANGSCAIDMTASVAVEVDGDDADVDAEFHGSICGYDADAVVDASAHG